MKTDWNCWFNISAFLLFSEKSCPFDLKAGILEESVFFSWWSSIPYGRHLAAFILGRLQTPVTWDIFIQDTAYFIVIQWSMTLCFIESQWICRIPYVNSRRPTSRIKEEYFSGGGRPGRGKSLFPDIFPARLMFFFPVEISILILPKQISVVSKKWQANSDSMNCDS